MLFLWDSEGFCTLRLNILTECASNVATSQTVWRGMQLHPKVSGCTNDLTFIYCICALLSNVLMGIQ